MHHLSQLIVRTVAVAITVCTPLQVAVGKTLFLAHYDGDTLVADFATGSPESVDVPGQSVAGLTEVGEGRWGRALDLRKPDGGRCAYDAVKNLDIRRGTVDFWYCFDSDEPGMYHPLFGWYNRPGSYDDGAFSVYTQGAGMVFDVYKPSSPSYAPYKVDIGKWHHLEINWDCSEGNGASRYNVYLDGKLVVRKTGAKALKAPGGRLHLGIWGYAYGHFLHGRIDELRITDQIEHLTNFTPPTEPYPTPRTANGLRLALRTGRDDLGRLQRVSMDLKRGQAKVEALARRLESINVNSADVAAVQTDLDDAVDSIKTLHRQLIREAGTRYSTVPQLHNQILVQLTYLLDEAEGLQRVVDNCSDMLDINGAVDAINSGRKVAKDSMVTLASVSDQFFDLFADAPGAKTDAIEGLKGFAANRKKMARMRELLRVLNDTSPRVAKARDDLATALKQLRTSPAFKAAFPRFRPFVPAKPGPVVAGPDGQLKRVIFGGGHGRTDTMSALEFDTLQENGVDVKWTAPDKFDATPYPGTIAQWRDYKIPLSDKVLHYAIGDGMYRPPWFAKIHGEDPDYYFASGYTGSGGFDYRHPLPRKLILQYLEEAARINGREPYTFLYKGPWEAHPYRGTSVDVPGKRTVAFQEHGFSRVAVQAFRDYLKKKHGTIDAINDKWRSKYGSFDEIEPPEPLIRAFVVSKDSRDQNVYTLFLPNKRLPGAATTALTYEFERCRKDLYADYLADCYAAVKRGDPQHPLASSTSGGIMGEILINSLDDLQMPARCVDMWGKHPSGGRGWDDSPYMWGLNRYFKKTLVALEYYGWAQEVIGDDFYGTWKLAKGATADDIRNAGRRDVWHELSWDRRMLLFYWTQKLVQMDGGFRESHSPMLRPWSGFIPAVKRRVMRVNDILVNVPIALPRIAVLHPGVSIINAYPTNACSKVTRDIFDRLLARQYHFGVVPESFILDGRDTLDNYDVVILPYAQYFADGFAEKLEEWVAAGGTLVSAGPYGLYNQYGVPLERGAKRVFRDLTFQYPTPDKFKLSWTWQALRNGRPIDENHLIAKHGRGTVLMTLDGRGFSRQGSASEANVGTEIGAKVTGADEEDTNASQHDDRSRPLKLPASKDTPSSVRALEKVLQGATTRRAYVTNGNVELVLRQQGDGPLYMSLLNWDYRDRLQTEVVVVGQYDAISDLSVDGGFPVPAKTENGLTRFSMQLGPGEGVMLQLQQSRKTP